MLLLRVIAVVWRRSVAFFARRMPLESPGACMAFSVLCLAAASFLLPKLEGCAGLCPLLADALDGLDNGWAWLRRFEWATIAAAYFAAGIFQARCLQLCFPDDYNPYGSAVSRAGGGKACLTIAGMPVDDDDLRTSVLVT